MNCVEIYIGELSVRAGAGNEGAGRGVEVVNLGAPGGSGANGEGV